MKNFLESRRLVWKYLVFEGEDAFRIVKLVIKFLLLHLNRRLLFGQEYCFGKSLYSNFLVMLAAAQL